MAECRNFLVIMAYLSNTKKNTLKRPFQSSGFTIIELLVVVMIMFILSGISIFKFREYTTNIELSNVTLDTALVIREAQTFGVTTVESNASGFQNAYGVHFSESEPDSYTFFVDSTNDDFWYNDSSEIIRQSYFEPGYVISNICVSTGGGQDCTVTELVTAFKRPNLSAHILYQNGGLEVSEAQIIFAAPDGSTSTVHTTVTGQIYVQ